MSNWESYVWEKWESSPPPRDNGWICLVVVQFSWAHTLARKFKGVAGYDCRYIANLRMYNVGLFTHCNCVVCSLISIVPKRYYNNVYQMYWSVETVPGLVSQSLMVNE